MSTLRERSDGSGWHGSDLGHEDAVQLLQALQAEALAFDDAELELLDRIEARKAGGQRANAKEVRGRGTAAVPATAPLVPYTKRMSQLTWRSGASTPVGTSRSVNGAMAPRSSWRGGADQRAGSGPFQERPERMAGRSHTEPVRGSSTNSS